MFDLNSMLNTLRSHKLYYSIGIVSLIVGFVTSVLLSLYVVEELNFDKNYKPGGPIYRINTKVNISGDEFKTATAPAPLAGLMKKEFEQVVETARLLANKRVVITYENIKIKEEKFYYTQSSIFSLFNFEFLAGDAETSLNNPGSIVMTESIASKYGEPLSMLNKSVKIDNKPFKVTGIIKDPENNTHMQPNGFLSLSTIGTKRNLVWSSLNDHTYIRLANESDWKNVMSELPAAHDKHSKEVYARFNAKVEFSLQPLDDIHFGEKLRYELDPQKIGEISDIYLSLFVAALIVVLASTNYAILSIAISMKRAREIGIRKVLGADRKQLAFQSIIEAVNLVFGVLLVSAVIVYLSVPYFNLEFSTQLNYGSILRWEFLLSVFAICTIVSLICSWYPAMYLSNFEPVKVLKSQQSDAASSFPLRNLLLITQLLLVVFMITSTWIIFEQFKFMRNSDLGFDPQNIIKFDLSGSGASNNVAALKQELSLHSDVENVGTASAMPGGGGMLISNSFEIQKEEGGNDTKVIKNFMVDEKFESISKIEIKEGRFFDLKYSTNDSAILVNEAFVAAMGWKEPIGKKMNKILNQKMDKKAFEVVGVVKDFHMRSFYEKIEPIAISFKPENTLVVVKLRDNASDTLFSDFRSIWERHVNDQVFEPRYVESDFGSQYKKEQQKGAILLLFTSLAIMIAVVGVFGIASYDIKQKSKEIAIRTVLGANSRELALLLSNNFFKLLLISNVLALPLSIYFMDSYLSKFAYHINIGAQPFLISALIVFVVTALAVSWHIVSALLNKPIIALKAE